MFIPHKMAAYTYHLNNTSRITDAPTIRSLTFILQDEFDDWRRRRDADPVADRDTGGGRSAAATPGRAREAHARGGRHRRPGSIGFGVAAVRSPTRRQSHDAEYFPVEELARDERFNKVTIANG